MEVEYNQGVNWSLGGPRQGRWAERADVIEQNQIDRNNNNNIIIMIRKTRPNKNNKTGKKINLLL